MTASCGTAALAGGDGAHQHQRAGDQGQRAGGGQRGGDLVEQRGDRRQDVLRPGCR